MENTALYHSCYDDVSLYKYKQRRTSHKPNNYNDNISCNNYQYGCNLTS